MKKELLDYTNWLLDMDRLKVTSQLPPFEDAEMMVDFYLKAKKPYTKIKGVSNGKNDKSFNPMTEAC